MIHAWVGKIHGWIPPPGSFSDIEQAYDRNEGPDDRQDRFVGLEEPINRAGDRYVDEIQENFGANRPRARSKRVTKKAVIDDLWRPIMRHRQVERQCGFERWR